MTQTADRISQQVLSIYMVQSATSVIAFHEAGTWMTSGELALLADAAGLRVTRIDGSYTGAARDARSRQMLVVLERAGT